MVATSSADVRRALVLLDRPIVVDLIELTLNHGMFMVRAASSLAEAEALLAGWQPHIAVILLASRAGRTVTREEILDAIWGTDFVAESNIVDRHIRSLRVKLQNDYKHPRFIATVPGAGYRFIPTFTNAGWTSDGKQGDRP
jgi:DNA-binding response OmpR family regulator